MSSPSNWFVQTGFGAVLGPMPTDALTEMIRTSALIATDLVRNESSAEWEPAGSVPGLFSSSPSELKSLSAAHTNTVTATKSSPESRSQQQSKVDHTPSLHSSQRPIVPTETVAYAFNKPTVPEPAQELDLVAKWKAERQQRPKRRDENRANDPLSDHIERDINEAELEPIPDIFADEAQDDPCDTDLRSSNELDGANSIPKSEPRPEPRQSVMLPSLLSQIEADQPLAQEESFAQARDRLMRSLPSKPIIAGALIVAFAVWWLWPESRRLVYHRLEAIWNELQTHRARPFDKTGMTNFVSKAQTELVVMVPKLELQTKSNSREVTLLLRASRDCLQPMLKRPLERDVAKETQLESLLDELAASYGLSQIQRKTTYWEPPDNTLRARPRSTEQSPSPKGSLPTTELAAPTPAQ